MTTPVAPTPTLEPLDLTDAALQSPVGLAVLSSDGLVLCASPAFVGLLGIPSGSDLHLWQPPKGFQRAGGGDCPVTAHPLLRCLHQDHGIDREVYGHPHPDGTMRWLRFHLTDRSGSDGRRTVTVVDVTHEHNVQAHLQARAAFRQATLRTAGVGGWRIEAEGQHPLYTEELRELIDLPPDPSFTVEDALQLYDRASRHVMADALQRAFRDGTGWDLELALVTRRGRRLWVRNKGRAVFQNNQVVRVEGALQDITDLRQARNEQVFSQARASRLERLLDTSPTLACVADSRGYFRDLAGPWEATLGFTESELRARPLIEFVLPEDVAKTEEAMCDLAMPGATVSGFTNRYRTAAGGHRTLEWHASILDGAICAVALDVTEREAQRHERIRLAAVAEHTKAGVLILDPDDRLIWANPAMYELSGFAPEQLIGQDARALLAGHHEVHGMPEATHRTLRDNQASRESFQAELQLSRADGTLYWAALEAQPMHDEEGTYIGMMAMLLDITERRAQAQALLKAKEAALDASASKSRFLASVSHEIRTPLHGVLGMAQVLGNTALDQEQTDALQTIQTSGTALLELLNDVLDVSKLEAGRMNLEQIPVDVAEVCTQAGKVFTVMAQDKGLDLHIDTEGCEHAVLADPGRIRQIVLNLLSNAIKFTTDGSVRLVATTSRSQSDDAAPNAVQVHIRVTDTGVGMDEPAKARLFHPFEQASVSTARTHGGTGLGLTICRELAGAMGGDIQVESAQGEGSTFTVALRVPYTDRCTLPKPAAPVALDALSGLKIVVADDNEINLRIAHKLLEGVGASVLTALDGAEAVELVSEVSPDVVLMDLQMPKMSGIEASQRLQQALGADCPPILALTADALSEHRRATQAAGMVGHIAKPFTLQELVQGITQVLPAASV